MAIEITQEPSSVVLSGNPVNYRVKDTELLSSNTEQHCIYLMVFLQSITSLYFFDINYNGEVYRYCAENYTYPGYTPLLPLKDAGESLAEWVDRIAAELRGRVKMNDLFYIENKGVDLVLIEREIVSDITVDVRIYNITPTGEGYVDKTILYNSADINLGEFHGIGCQPEKTIEINLTVPAGTIETVPENYGAGIEKESLVSYTEENELFKLSDGSKYADFNLSSLVKFMQRGHFSMNIDDKYVIWDLLQKFSFYFYALQGTPMSRSGGIRSNIIHVIDAEITRTMQAKLNGLGTTIWQYIIDNKLFLTWAPDEKEIDIYQPERLYWIMREDRADMKWCVKEYFSDDTTATNTVATFSALQYQVVELSAAFLDVRSGAEKTLTKFEVWIEDSEDTIISEVRTFIMDYTYHGYARWWVLHNSFGMYECLRTTGKAIKSGNIEKSFIELDLPDEYTETDRERQQVSSKITLRIKCGTGYLNEQWARYYLELFDSDDVYNLQLGKLIPAEIDADEFVYKSDGENINTHTFVATLTTEDEEDIDISLTLPIIGDFNEDFNESFYYIT